MEGVGKDGLPVHERIEENFHIHSKRTQHCKRNAFLLLQSSFFDSPAFPEPRYDTHNHKPPPPSSDGDGDGPERPVSVWYDVSLFRQGKENC